MSEEPGKYVTASDVSDALEESEIVEKAMDSNRLCGVYFLVKESKIVYVGQSTNIPYRIQQHKSQKDFDKHFYVICDERDLDEVEQFYINKFKPVLNKTFGVSRRAGTTKNWLRAHPVFGKFSDITLREWIKRSGMKYEEVLDSNYPKNLTTFGSFYRWSKRKYPHYGENQILPNDVTKYMATARINE